ncbi:hypothetical protein LJK87_16140 [Paenibacillus sp. P25]|nr:hypothetical protein LJK87_16140 [Paenibacillus sp. P25]
MYDVVQDPFQNHPISDPGVEQRMIGLLKRLMEANEAPPEQYVRLGL